MAAINIRHLLLLRSRLIYSYYFYKRVIKSKSKLKRRYWVRQIYNERDKKGEFNLLVKEMQLRDHEYFQKCFRMSPKRFEELLRLIAPDITKKVTKMREPISAEQRLAVTLRYLTTGDAHTTIGASYRISPTTVGRIIHEMCLSIWNRLNEKGCMIAPTTDEEWIKVADDFEIRWNFPNCLRAIDGKHIHMFAPPNAHSSYYNYKGTHSIVLMAVCDSKYRFQMVDIGDSGRQSDGSVYHNGNIGYSIENNKLNLPKDRKLKNSEHVLPFVFIGDDSFGLKRHMMKPYPSTNMGIEKLIFNYRLSRARSIIENTFGVMASRFRVFYRPIIGDVEKVIAITKATVMLHNFLINTDDNFTYCPNNLVDQDNNDGLLHGEWREDANRITGFQPINRLASNNYTESAKIVRDTFKDYFNREGFVSWQWESE